MARTVRQLKDIKNIDLVLEVVDARAIDTSKNNELTVGINKPKLTIALKSDLADTSSIKNKNILIGSIKNKSFKAQILAAIYDTFKDKLVNLKRKGLLIPQFYILVVGLPNVGKTSLINLLSSGAKLIAENRPGVTKRKQLIKINENFLLYDTPGVMVKNVETEKEGFTLSLINVINKNILPLNEVTE
jgi:ribosome biogenesis GTPase A